MCGTACWRRGGRIQWERLALAHGQAQRRVVRVGCATRGTNHDAATTMLSVRSRGRDWVCDARGTGMEAVVQTVQCRQMQIWAGWVCCAVLLLLLLLHDLKCEQHRAGFKLPTLLVFCTLRSAWPLPAPLTCEHGRVCCTCVRAFARAHWLQVGVLERRGDN